MSVTAKVFCNSVVKNYENAHSLSFVADYQDGRNKEWASATPSISVSMTVNDEAVKHFELGKAYTLTFTPED